MFDPLDLYSAEEVALSEPSFWVRDEQDGTDAMPLPSLGDEPIDILHLPNVRLAPAKVVLGILLLLKPERQVNYQSTFKKSSIPPDLEASLFEWYTVNFPLPQLDSVTKIYDKIPKLKSMGSEILKWYVSILQEYQSQDCAVSIEVVKQVSLRISENCGRSAQPAMVRDFAIAGLEHTIALEEPSLTADNLGWKTWGASLILSQILVKQLDDQFHHYNNNNHGGTHHVLELGSGTGLVGIAWACKWRELTKSNGMHIYLTDLPEIVPNLEANILRNGLPRHMAQSAVLDWTNPTSFVAQHNVQRFDTILVADPIYSPQHPEWITAAIAAFLSKPGGQCHLEVPLRPKYALERTRLWQLLDHAGLQIVHEQHDEGFDDWGEVEYVYKKIVWRP